MACIPAPACRKALDEATHLWPRRNRASDGICASAAHHNQNPHSDHEVGEAFDLTHDPTHGVDCAKLSERLRQWVLGDLEDRVKYIIFNRRIFNPSISPNWRPYSGASPHTEHMHVSILHAARNDTSSWWTKEDDMTPEQEAKLDALSAKVQEVWIAAYEKKDGKLLEATDQVRDLVLEAVEKAKNEILAAIRAG